MCDDGEDCGGTLGGEGFGLVCVVEEIHIRLTEMFHMMLNCSFLRWKWNALPILMWLRNRVPNSVSSLRYLIKLKAGVKSWHGVIKVCRSSMFVVAKASWIACSPEKGLGIVRVWGWLDRFTGLSFFTHAKLSHQSTAKLFSAKSSLHVCSSLMTLQSVGSCLSAEVAAMMLEKGVGVCR